MGNQTSHPAQEGAPSSRPSHNLHQNLRNLLRPPGALGLNKTELDKRCQPSGLYPSCQWDDKAIRRLVGDGKIAARLKGTELRTSPADTECPICFLHYPEVNVTKCCQANLCTECYLQVRPQKVVSPCPFCNSPKVQIVVAKVLDPLAIRKREEEEQMVIEAKIRARAEYKQHGSPGRTESADDTVESSDDVPEITLPTSTEFGSSLAQNDRVARMRARSESFASESSSHNTSSESLLQDIAALAMTPEERALLEQEMRVQQSHPLAQRLEAEQMERRLQNEREYLRTQAGRLRELRARRELMGRALGVHSANRIPTYSRSSLPLSTRGSRDWNRIVNSFEQSGNSAQSLDDLVVLEAAIMLSMEEEARRRDEGEDQNHDIDEGNNEDRAPEELPSAQNGTADLGHHMSSLMRTLVARRRGMEMNSRRSGLDNETVASMLLRGISEEEQIAMAIAASLAESNATAPSSTEDNAAEASANNPSEAGATSTGGHIYIIPDESDSRDGHVSASAQEPDLGLSGLPARSQPYSSGFGANAQVAQYLPESSSEVGHEDVSGNTLASGSEVGAVADVDTSGEQFTAPSDAPHDEQNG